MSKVRSILFSIILLVQLPNCTEPAYEEPGVITEQILYVSGEILRLTGRVLAVGPDGLSDHGFLVAETDDFQDPLILSLGKKSKPGRFYGETETLDPEITYYCRSYILSNGEIILGNIKSFETLIPALLSFSPITALPGSKATVLGKNFSKDTRIFFGSKEAKIEKIQFESRAEIVIPPIGDNSVVSVTVHTKDRVLVYPETFEYIFGTWKKVGEFVDPVQLSGPISFKKGNKFVYGLGRDFFSGFKSKAYELDLNTWSWEAIAFAGKGVAHAFSSDGMIGSGQDSLAPIHDYLITDRWYEYEESNDPAQPSALVLKGQLPFTLFKSRSFTVGDTLFVLGGYLSDRSENRTIWSYNKLEESWSVFSQLPFHLDSEYPYFMYNETPYFITLEGKVWEFLPLSDTWNAISEVPFRTDFSGLQFSGMSEVVGDKAYLGVFLQNPSVWEYDITKNSWKSKVAFPGGLLNINSATFTHNDKIYLIRFTNRSGGTSMPIWEFDPTGLK